MALNQVARSFNQAVNETVQKRIFVGGDDILLNPDVTPLLAMTSKVGNRKPVNVPRIEWVEDDFVGYWGQVSAGATNIDSVTTAIPVVDVTLFAAGDEIAFPKADSSSAAEEVARVTAITGTTSGTLTVTRGIGGSGADTIGSTQDIRILGPAFAEGASLGVSRNTTKAVKISYTQIFRRPARVTKTMAASAQYGVENERTFQQDKAMQELKRDIESVGLFGRASESLASPGSIRTSMGLKSRLTTNVVNANGTLTETGMLNFVQNVFDDYYAGREKLFLAAPTVISALDFFSNGNLLYGPDETVLGVKVQRYRSTHGELLVTRDLLVQDGPLGGIGWGDEAFAIDVPSILFHPLSGNGENRDTHLMLDVAKNGDDAYVDEWLCEGGWSIRFEARHGRLYNATSFA